MPQAQGDRFSDCPAVARRATLDGVREERPAERVRGTNVLSNAKAERKPSERMRTPAPEVEQGTRAIAPERLPRPQAARQWPPPARRAMGRAATTASRPARGAGAAPRDRHASRPLAPVQPRLLPRDRRDHDRRAADPGEPPRRAVDGADLGAGDPGAAAGDLRHPGRVPRPRPHPAGRRPGGGQAPSALETIALVAVLDNFAYILKRELLWLPLFGWFLSRSEMVAIDRSKGSRALALMNEEAARAMRDGRRLIIFPEGTRRPAGAAPAYKFGVAHIYDRLGCRACRSPSTPACSGRATASCAALAPRSSSSCRRSRPACRGRTSSGGAGPDRGRLRRPAAAGLPAAGAAGCRPRAGDRRMSVG